MNYFFLIWILALFPYKSISQNIQLQLKGKNEIENKFINKLKAKKEFKDTKEIHKEVLRISQILKYEGYFLNSIDSLVKKQKVYTAYFSLNKKIESVCINTNLIDKNTLKEVNLTTNNLELKIKELEDFTENISQTLEKKGFSFAKIQFKNFRIKKDRIITDLIITKTTKRNIDKIIYQNYKNFPKSFSDNYLNLNKKNIFNSEKIEEISKLTKKLRFVEEIKPPEVLFKKDSTILYMYVKKKQNNSFDGLINFVTDENGSILFNGHIDLKLNNVLDKGETFNLFWNQLGEESQELEISSNTPYVFGTKITPSIDFSIFKQDSTFINTRFNLTTSYQINKNSNVNLIFSTENSIKKLNEADEVESFQNLFFGTGYEYRIKNTDFFNSDKFSLELNIKFGERNTTIKTNQIKIESKVSYLFNINKRSHLYLRNQSALINSNSFLQNELYRIGGVNSIRGFNNKSIFANNYSIQNIEYRFLTSTKSYFYTISDLAVLTNNNINDKLLGLGIGYLFTTSNSQINISSVLGNSFKNNFTLQNPQLLISWITFF